MALRSFSGVFAFGDSLVDVGNALELAETYDFFPFTSLPNGAPTAARGYYNGRFTDGSNYTDLIANKYSGVPTKPVSPSATTIPTSASRSASFRIRRAIV